MKKLAIILALLMIPAFAFGMDTISDSDLEAVTGQAGVSIGLNSIMIQKTGGTTSYGDADDGGEWVSIVAEGTSTKTIGFHSVGGRFDALTIDIVNVHNVDGHNLRTVIVASDAPVRSNAAIKITLPDVIQIEEIAAQQRIIYMSDGADPNANGGASADELIRIWSTAGTTRIIAADMGTSFTQQTTATNNPTASSYASGLNTTILITAHD